MTRGGNRVAGDDQFPFDGLPVAPKGWDATHLADWNALLSLIPKELFRRVDGYQLRILVELLVRERKMAEALRDDPLDSKLCRTHLAVCQQIQRLSAHFGLSPIDRQRLRLSFQPVKEEDPFEELANRFAGR